jgi:NTE family protein
MKHLVLSGGGLKGLATIGAYKIIEESLNLESITAVSVGAVIGMLIVAGYTGDEMEKLIIEKDISTLKQVKITSLVSNYGLDSGVKIIKWLGELLKVKGFSTSVTLKQFYEYKRIHFKIGVTNLTKIQLEFFDHVKHPNVLLLDAVKMSFSIPFVFSCVKYNGDVYVDGCMIDNYPIFLNDDVIDDTIGIRLYSEMEQDNKIDSFPDYIGSIIKLLLYNNDYSNYEDNTINIMVPSNLALDFTLSKEDKTSIIQLGIDAAREFNEKKKIYTNINTIDT